MGIREDQEFICDKFGCAPSYITGDEMVGVSRSLLKPSSEWPVSGVRHLPAKETSGWCIWSGKYLDDPDFFVPWHASHLMESRPDIAKYLGLPSGWGFVIAPDYEDVWQDNQLLVEYALGQPKSVVAHRPGNQ